MPVKRGLFKLYDAKSLVMEALRGAQQHESPESNLWLAVIEQAIFDAHLHSTGRKYPATVYVADARSWFGSAEFDRICESLGLEARWVESLIEPIGEMARDLRGKEYELAAIPHREKRRPTRRAHAGRRPIQLRLYA